MEFMSFSIIHNGLVICSHPEGIWQIGEIPVDFVCHFLPGDRVHRYIPLIMMAPQLLYTCEALCNLIDSHLGFPYNSLVLIRAKQTIAKAKGTTSDFIGWPERVDYPCILIPIKES